MHSCNSCNSSFILSGHIPPDMNMSRLIIVLAILMLSIHLTASEFYPPIPNSIDASADIDTSFQLISSYVKDTEEVFVQFNLCLLYTSPSPRDRTRSRMPSSA